MLTVIKRRSVAGNGDAEIQRVKVGGGWIGLRECSQAWL